VAIARALATSPEVLLMDEPLAALDAQRKAEVLPYLEQLQRHLRIPVIYVSHSMDEVARLAQHMVLLCRQGAGAGLRHRAAVQPRSAAGPWRRGLQRGACHGARMTPPTI
jgi:ABC-type molybdate transport system ATPase subunit